MNAVRAAAVVSAVLVEFAVSAVVAAELPANAAVADVVVAAQAANVEPALPVSPEELAGAAAFVAELVACAVPVGSAARAACAAAEPVVNVAAAVANAAPVVALAPEELASAVPVSAALFPAASRRRAARTHSPKRPRSIPLTQMFQ